jgi:serine/threonine protein kinase
VGRLTEDQALFYFGEVVLGLEHLHSLDIAYRDLKPENVLLDLDGHVKLADFGLARQMMSAKSFSYTFCGSPEYLSPEMLKRQGHTRSVDFYSLGALLFEMVTGLPPFYSTDKEMMYQQVLSQKLEVPRFLSSRVRALIKSLLSKEPSRRLGHDRPNLASIKTHPWCARLDWERLANRAIDPPFRPSLTTSNFDSEYTRQPIGQSEGAAVDHGLSGFSYNCDDLDEAEEQTSMRSVSSAVCSSAGEQTIYLSSDSINEPEETKSFTFDKSFAYPVFPYRLLKLKRTAHAEEYQVSQQPQSVTALRGRLESLAIEHSPYLPYEDESPDNETPKSPVLAPKPAVFTVLRDRQMSVPSRKSSFSFALLPVDP